MTRLNLLFDLDGTLTDSREGIVRSIQYALDRVGLPGIPEEDLHWCVGPPLVESLAKLLGSERSHLAPQALEHYQCRYSEVGIYENRPYDGIRECLDELDGFADLYVATSNLTTFSRRILAHFSLEGHFRKVQGCRDWSGADKGRLIADLLRSEGFDPDRTVMIGDRRHDIQGARENRIASVGILWGYGTEQELTVAGAEVLLGHPNELKEYFRNYKSSVKYGSIPNTTAVLGGD